ncbi:MAG: DMT family transporter [bacterium]|nr:DMT family transporter [bacterium]
MTGEIRGEKPPDISKLRSRQRVQVYGLTFMIAVISTVLPSFMIAAAIEKIGAGTTSLLSGVGPLFTTFLGIVLLNETFTQWHFVGMILVLTGALILSYKRRRI